MTVPHGFRVRAEASVLESKHFSLSSVPAEASGAPKGQDTALLMRNGSGPFLIEADPMFFIFVILFVASGTSETESEAALEHLLSASEELELSLFDVYVPMGSSTLFLIWNGSGSFLKEEGAILLSGFLLLMRKLADFLGELQYVVGISGRLELLRFLSLRLLSWLVGADPLSVLLNFSKQDMHRLIFPFPFPSLKGGREWHLTASTPSLCKTTQLSLLFRISEGLRAN